MRGFMKRWHEDYSRTHREWKNRCLMMDRWDLDKGRFRKQDAWDCGKVHCFICHSDKYPKREHTRKEILANLKLKESLKDLDL